MILNEIAKMAGQSLPSFRCSKCQQLAEIMWQGLEFESITRQGPKWADGTLYLCRECAVDVCLGLLRDVAELEQQLGHHDPMRELDRLNEVFKKIGQKKQARVR